MFYSSRTGITHINFSKKRDFLGKLQRKTVNFENGKFVQALPESNMTQTSSQDVSSIHEEQL